MEAEDEYDSPWNSWNGQQSITNFLVQSSCISSIYDTSKSFAENGGGSLDALTTLLELRKEGSKLTIDEFLNFRTLINAPSGATAFIQEDIKEIAVEEAAKLIADSFIKKGVLEKCGLDLRAEHLVAEVKRAWSLLQQYSFGFRDEAGKLRALALFADIVDLKSLTSQDLHPHLQDISSYLHFLMAKVNDQVPDTQQRGIILEKFMFGAGIDNTANENIWLINMMEHEFHQRAKKAGYKVALAQNASPLTQQLAELMGCQRLLTDDPRQFMNQNGHRPFSGWDESTRITVDMMVYADHV